MKIIKYLIVAFIVSCACSYYAYTLNFGQWEITKKNKSDITWVDFIWTSQIINGKNYEKTAMLIPSKIEGISNPVTFQFDIGANRTMLYENSLSSFYFQDKNIENRVKNFNFPLNFLKSKRLFKELTISFGEYEMFSESSSVFGDYGNLIPANKVSEGDTIHIGTIGADLFQGRVLIIDYPNRKFAICEDVPKGYGETLIDIELDRNGKPVLPLRINSETFRISFDNGSSLFPLITSTKNINKFSTNPVLDSIEVSSWGEKHIVTSRIIKDTFYLAGRPFNDIKVYENHSGLGIDKKTDGMAGNFLFWDNTIIIDFKNKKFGVY